MTEKIGLCNAESDGGRHVKVGFFPVKTPSMEETLFSCEREVVSNSPRDISVSEKDVSGEEKVPPPKGYVSSQSVCSPNSEDVSPRQLKDGSSSLCRKQETKCEKSTSSISSFVLYLGFLTKSSCRLLRIFGCGALTRTNKILCWTIVPLVCIAFFPLVRKENK